MASRRKPLIAPSNVYPRNGGFNPLVVAYLPENFDLGQFDREYRDGVAYVVGRLYLARHIDARVREGDEWLPLDSRFLARVVGRDDRLPVLKALTGAGVVECDRSYQPGKYCRHYRLSPGYRDAKFRHHVLRGEVANRVRKYREARHAEATREPVWSRLRADLDRVTVARDWMRYSPSPGLFAVALGGDELFATVCKQGRFHTNLTNLHGELRHHLRVDGKPIWTVDVANSQPLVLALTLQGRSVDGYAEYAQMLGREIRGKTGSRTTPAPPGKATPPAPATPSLFLYSSSGPGLNDFLQACLAGRVYEPVLARANALKTQGEPYTRQEIKAKLLTVFYGNREDMETKAGVAFRELWPAAWEAIYAAKPATPGGRPRGKRKPKNQRPPAAGAGLAKEMQRRESHLVVWRAAARFHRLYPLVPVLTCHDSFLTDEDNIGKAAEVLKAEFLDAYGVAPVVTTKPW